MNHVKTTIGNLRKFLTVALHSKRSVFLLSTPGLGKTTEITAFSHSIGAELHVFVASLLDRIDLAGIPHVASVGIGDQKDCRVTKFAPMQAMAMLSKEMNPHGGPAVLYFNEVNSAPESVLATLLRLFNERAIGELTLRDNVMLIADGNPASSQSIGRDLPMALRRRFMWLALDASLGEWKQWGLLNGVDGRILSFFEVPAFHPLFNNFDPKKRDALTYACPASWSHLSNTLRALTEAEAGGTRLTEYDNLVLFSGEVGQEAGAAFAGFLKLAAQIPDAAQVLNNAKRAELPKDVQMRALLAGSIINLVRDEPKLVEPAMLVAHRFFTPGPDSSPEYGLFLARSISSIPDLKYLAQKTAAFGAMAKFLTTEPEMFDALRAKPAVAA